MNTVRLHGSLAKEFGDVFVLDIQSAREAFLALCSQLEGFEQRVKEGSFRIVRAWQKKKVGLDYNTLDLSADNCTFHIYPAVQGGKGGLGKVLLGVAIIGLAIAFAPGAIAAIGAGGASFSGAMAAGIGFMGITYGGIAAFGAMIAFGGLAMMFAPSPKAQGTGKAAKDDSSFILSGPVNTLYQGVAVPIVYGEYVTGSVVISSELTIAQLIAAGSSYDADTAWTGMGYTGYPATTVTGFGMNSAAVVNQV